MIVPAIICAAIAPIDLLTTDYTTMVVAFSLQGAFAGTIDTTHSTCPIERVPTGIRATPAAFGAVAAGVRVVDADLFRGPPGIGFALTMLVATVGALISVVITRLSGSLIACRLVSGFSTTQES